MSQQIATENRLNWTVKILKCPMGNWSNVLVELWQFLENIKEIDIPHFLIRRTEGETYIVSLRVLRDPSNKRAVEGALDFFLTQHQLERVEVEPSDRRDGWIMGIDPIWNRERCELLNRLCGVVVSLAENNLFEANERIKIAHLFTIMLGLYETGETAVGGYIDLATGTIRRYQLG